MEARAQLQSEDADCICATFGSSQSRIEVAVIPKRDPIVPAEMASARKPCRRNRKTRPMNLRRTREWLP